MASHSLDSSGFTLEQVQGCLGRENLFTSPVSISYHRTGILRDGVYAKMVPCQLKDRPQLPYKIRIIAKGGTFESDIMELEVVRLNLAVFPKDLARFLF